MGGRKRKAKLPKYKLLNKHEDGKYINEHGTFTGKTAEKAAAKAWKHHKKEFNLLQGVNHVLLLSVETNEPMEPISMDTWSTKKHGKRVWKKVWKKGRGRSKKNNYVYKMKRKHRRSTQRRRTRSKRGGDCGCSSKGGPISAIINQLGGYEYSRRATRDRKKRLRSRIIGASRRRRHTLRRKTRKHHPKRHRGRTRRRRRRRPRRRRHH